MRRSFVRFGMIAVLAAASWGSSARADYTFADFSKATEASVIVPRTFITVQRFTRYRPDANKEPVYDQWSWSPRFEISLRGPITGGGQVTVEVTKPNGKKWLSLPLDTPELGPGEWQTKKTDDQEETAAITEVGLFGYQIVLSNALENSKKVLVSGKFEVSKYKYPLGKKPGETEFFINHDWLLPVGYLELDKQVDAEAPILTSYFWFKGQDSKLDPDAYVYYQGKQIYSSKSPGASRGIADISLTTPGVDAEKTWFRWKFTLASVRGFRATEHSASSYPDAFWLDKNPGEYEIKVLRGGKLSRTLKFTVGADGKIVDNGIASNNKLSTTWFWYPVTVSPGTDPAFSTAPSKGAFYGNPIKLK